MGGCRAAPPRQDGGHTQLKDHAPRGMKIPCFRLLATLAFVVSNVNVHSKRDFLLRVNSLLSFKAHPSILVFFSPLFRIFCSPSSAGSSRHGIDASKVSDIYIPILYFVAINTRVDLRFEDPGFGFTLLLPTFFFEPNTLGRLSTATRAIKHQVWVLRRISYGGGNAPCGCLCCEARRQLPWFVACCAGMSWNDG